MMEKRTLVLASIALALSLTGLALAGVALILSFALPSHRAPVATVEPAVVRVVVEVATPVPSIPAPSTPPAPLPPVREPSGEPSAVVEMKSCLVMSDTATATFVVRSSSPVALFFDTPILSDGEHSAAPTPDSLREAQFASLDRIMSGYAEFSLVFPTTGLDPNRAWRVILNPRHGENDPVAPRFSFECRR